MLAQAVIYVQRIVVRSKVRNNRALVAKNVASVGDGVPAKRGNPRRKGYRKGGVRRYNKTCVYPAGRDSIFGVDTRHKLV